MALDTVLSELEAEGYETRAFIVPACGVDAPHRRDRVAIVARNNDGKPDRREPFAAFAGEAEGQSTEPCGVCHDVDNSNGCRLDRHIGREQLAQSQDGCWWPVEPNVGRVAHGVSHRVDRLKGLGNAVIPAQFYPFFMAIAEIERSEKR